MEQHNLVELRRLIDRAVSDTSILIPQSNRRGLSPLDFRQFRDIVSEHRADSPEAVSNFTRQYTPVESTGRDALSHYLRSLSSLDKYFDTTRERVTCVGSPVTSIVSPGFSLSKVSSRIIISAIINSVDVATETLHNFLLTDSFPIRLVFLLIGAKISKEIILDEQCKLIPADDAISLVGMSSLSLSQLASLDKDILGCALVVETNVQPGARDDDTVIAPNVHLQGVAEADIGLLCGILTLVSQQQLHPFSWTHIIDQETVDTLPIVERAPTDGWTVLNHLVPIFPSVSSLSYLDTQELCSLVRNYVACVDDVQRRLQMPILRFQSTTGRMKEEDRYIDLAIAFEAMLISKYERNIGKRLAERATWLYAETEEEKLWAENEVRAFYRHRSAIVHGEEKSGNVDLYSKAESIFVVCLKNIIKRRQFLDWDSVDLQGTIGNPVVDDPSAVLSTKHDATSWTIGELKHIDEALSHYWKTTLQGVSPGSRGIARVRRTRDAQATIAKLEDSNEVYVHVDPYRLRDIHPLWLESSESGDDARIWHCSEDIRRHIRLWIEAALKRRLTVVIDSNSEYCRDLPI